LVKAVSPYKIIILTETGGILDEDGQIVSFLNPQKLGEISNITGGMRLKIEEISELLDFHKEASVVITSAENLLKEMFTVKGSGTFIKAYSICKESDVARLDLGRLKMLLESSFDKKLSEDYFEGQFTQIIYEKNYEGLAILKDLDGIAYLDKLAVAKHRQETGLGGCLWEEVVSNHSKLVWRVHPKNPANAFYFKVCSGCMKFTDWNVFWCNLNQEEILKTTREVLELPKTML
jgi:bifunctional N-acetylglutamate synthase/kinase